MSELVGIVGTSGSGKSTSIRNLDPSSTFIINVAGKEMPFKGWKSKYSEFSKDNLKGNYLNSDNAGLIIKTLGYISENRPEIKTIILDDCQYVMGFEYMRRAREKGYELFKEVGQNIFNLTNKAKELRSDIKVFALMHPDVDTDVLGNKLVKMKTIGAMVDKYITLDGLFTTILYTLVEKTNTGVEYTFTTQTDGYNTAKSPMGMFDSYKIPNDLSIVIKAIDEYYN